MTTDPGEPGATVEDASSLQLAALLAYAAADYEGARAHAEAAFRVLRSGGDAAAAALVAMDLAEIHQSVFGNRAAANGWLARARRSLEPLGDVVELGYLELAIMACDRPDASDLAASAERALAIARRFDDSDLEIRALADGGLALVCQGRLREGFAMLDEALIAISSGEARRLETPAKSMCSLLTSCDRAADLRRVDEWARLVEAAPAGGTPVVLAEHCRMVRSGLTAAAGRWDAAEAELEELLAGMHVGSPHRIESMARLADLRVHRGRLDAAASLIERYEDAVAMRAPLARLLLARGEAASAVAVVEQGLRDLVADRLRAAPLLDLAVQAELARGDVAAAGRFAQRLADLADASEAPSLRADAACALGRVAAATGDLASAIDLFEQAWRAFDDSSRPLHAGLARLELAAAQADHGDVAAATVEARAALACFERLGASPLVDRAAQLLRGLGVRVGRRSDAAAALAGLTAREAEVLALVRQGLTNAEIGARLFISAKTAEHHVGRLLAKLGARTRAEAAALAADAGVGTPGADGGVN